MKKCSKRKGKMNILLVDLKPWVYKKYRYEARMEPLIVVEGILQKKEGIANVIAEKLTPLRQESKRQLTMYPLPAPTVRNFA